MHFLKFFPMMSLTAAMGLVACSDSSSNADVIENCKITSQDPFTFETTLQEGVTSVTTFELKEDKIVQTMFTIPNIPSEGCEELMENNEDYDIDCSGNTFIATSKKSYTQSGFEKFKQTFINGCKAGN